MEMTCFELRDDGRLLHTDISEALDRWRCGDGRFWVNLEASELEERAWVLDQISLRGLLRRRCLEVGEGSAVVALPDGTFAEWPVFTDQACSSRAQVAVLCVENLLLSMHSEPIDEAIHLPSSEDVEGLHPASTSSLLCALLTRQSSVTTRSARMLRDRVIELGQRMDDDPDSVDADDLDALKHEVLLMDSVAEEQSETFGELVYAASRGFEVANVKGSLGLLTTTARGTSRLVDRIDQRVENLLRRAQDRKQELVSGRLGVLTIVSAIFLPLSLLAGIWGMNFERMPELDEPWAYPAALALMAMLATIAAMFFYKRGWFD